MPFIKPLPEWFKSATAPATSKKTSGWGVGEKPPASIFDWFFNTVYLGLKELQENAIHKDEKGANSGVATLDASGKVPAVQLNVQAPADATTAVKGIVKLNSATNSVDETTAATPKAIKAAMDAAAAAQTTANGKTSFSGSYTDLTNKPTIPSNASQLSVADAGNYFTATDTEGSLQEIGQTLNAMRGNLITSTNSILGS